MNEPIENKEGVSDETSPLTLDIEDRLLIETIDQRMKNTEKYNKETLKLDERQKANEKFWVGDQIKEGDLAEYLEPYKDNLIWQDSEKRIEIASGRMPDIILTPAGESEAKRERTKLIEKQLKIEFGSSKMKRLIKDGLRQHGIYFLSAIKCRWDPNKSENGDYVFELVRPSRFGVDHTGTISHDGFTIDNIDMVWELIEEPLAVTLAKFPQKAQELKDKLKAGTDPKRLISKFKYYEIHFTWYTNDGQPMECTTWKYLDLLLDKQKTANYDYEGYTKRVWEDEPDVNLPDKQVKSKIGKFYRNHFEKPRKPYILFSHQNLGKSPYDDTSPIEQSIPLQKSVNKRGRQITDIADRMRPRFAFNGTFTKKQVEAISNDPEDHIYISSSEPIGNIVTSFQSLGPSPMLYNDLVANRGQIDSKFSTHGTLRGEIGGQSNESGISKQITREGDLVSSDDIVDIVIERVVFEMASWVIQMEKLYYEKPHHIRDIGPDGEMVHAELSRDLIDDGIAVNVKSSSVDKVTRRNDAFNLAKVKGIDPLTLAEDMDYPNPKERTRRLMYFLMGQQDQWARYMHETGLLEEGNAPSAPGQLPAGPEQPGQPQLMDAQQAQQDLEALINGQDVQPVGIPGPDYVQVFAQLINSGDEFANLPAGVQNKIQAYLQQLQEMVNQQAAQLGGQ